MSGVHSLAELSDRYRFDVRDAEGRSDVQCGYCRARLERVVEKNARRWFLEHACVSPLPRRRRRLSREQLDRLDELVSLAALLTQRPSAVGLYYMLAETRHYGGHRHGLVPPSPEQLAHAERVDVLLARILVRPATRIVELPQRAQVQKLAA